MQTSQTHKTERNPNLYHINGSCEGLVNRQKYLDKTLKK